MSLRSKLREVRICLDAGRVTLPYPASPRPPPEGFRGRPVFDVERCIGCAGCAANCPARAVLVTDLCQELRVIKYVGRRCTSCGRCADVCQEKAITMSGEFEIATDAPSDLEQRLEIFMGTCRRCGRCFEAPNVLERLKLEGYRCDDLERDRWIYRSSDHAPGSAAPTDVTIELEG